MATGPAVTTVRPITSAPSAGYEATESEVTQADPAQTTQAVLRDVRPEDTVRQHVGEIIDEDSGLMQRARAQALSDMNARGGLNSSMAIGAAHGAVMDRALPIAQQDADTYQTQGRDNQTHQNEAGMFNAEQQNVTSRFNAGESNTTARANAGLASRASEFGADARNQDNRLNAQIQSDAARQDADAANQGARLQYSENAETRRQQIDNDFRAAQNQLDRTQQTQLAEFEALENQRLQATEAGQTIGQQFQREATAIMTSPNLDAAGKDQALQNLYAMTRASLDTADMVADLGLAEDFDIDFAAMSEVEAGGGSETQKPTRGGESSAPELEEGGDPGGGEEGFGDP